MHPWMIKAALSALLIASQVWVVWYSTSCRHSSTPRPDVARDAAASTAKVTVASILSRSTRLLLLNNSQHFTYVVEALHLSLLELGIRAAITTSITPGDNNTYILLATHTGTAASLPKHYIAYNWEQLTTHQWPQDMFDRLKAAQMVWDYSLENIKVLNRHGVNATVHLPLGYTSNLENHMPRGQRDVDVMFVGWLQGKRMAKLQQLQALQCAQPHLKVVITENHWGERLLELYRRSKVALNLHFYDGATILEVHRILPIVASKVLVLSEHSNDSWWDNEYKDLVNFTDEANITQPVLRMLAQFDVEAEAERRYQQLLACCR